MHVGSKMSSYFITCCRSVEDLPYSKKDHACHNFTQSHLRKKIFSGSVPQVKYAIQVINFNCLKGSSIVCESLYK